jgi:hypothetical protein
MTQWNQTVDQEIASNLANEAAQKWGSSAGAMVEKAFNAGRRDGWNQAFEKLKQAAGRL